MLCSMNSGKYLTKTWEEQRMLCVDNKDNFTPGQQAYYEVHGTGVYDGLGRQLDANLILENQPVDPLTAPVLVDHRDTNEVGG